MTGYLRIGGASVLGVLIVLSAFRVANLHSRAETGPASLEIAAGREYIAATDKDENGIADWEEQLLEQSFETIDTPFLGSTTDSYTPPITFTGKFAEAFFQDYMNAKQNGADLSDPTALINEAVGSIEANTESKIYSQNDLSIISDSESALREYGNAIGRNLERHAPTGIHEMSVLNEALQKNDQSLLEPLGTIKLTYADFLSDTLATHVPQSLAANHVALVSAVDAIHADVTAMYDIFNDPLLGLARIKRYEEDAKVLSTTFRNILSAVETAGITYREDEPGALLYALKP